MIPGITPIIATVSGSLNIVGSFILTAGSASGTIGYEAGYVGAISQTPFPSIPFWRFRYFSPGNQTIVRFQNNNVAFLSPLEIWVNGVNFGTLNWVFASGFTDFVTSGNLFGLAGGQTYDVWFVDPS